MVRKLEEIELSEISVVAFAAYIATSVSVRSKEQFQSQVDRLTATTDDDQQTPNGDQVRNQQKLALQYRILDLLTKGQ
jgi:phage head maturation protease